MWRCYDINFSTKTTIVCVLRVILWYFSPIPIFSCLPFAPLPKLMLVQLLLPSIYTPRSLPVTRSLLIGYFATPSLLIDLSLFPEKKYEPGKWKPPGGSLPLWPVYHARSQKRVKGYFFMVSHDTRVSRLGLSKHEISGQSDPVA